MTCFVWANGIAIWVKDDEELVCRSNAISATLVDRGLFATAHKSVFLRDEIKRCGRWYSWDGKRRRLTRIVFGGS